MKIVIFKLSEIKQISLHRIKVEVIQSKKIGYFMLETIEWLVASMY